MFNTTKLFQKFQNKNIFIINKNVLNKSNNYNKSFFSTNSSFRNNNNNNNNSNNDNGYYKFNNNQNNFKSSSSFKIPIIIGSTSTILSMIGLGSTSIVSCETINEVTTTKTVVIPEKEYDQLNRQNKVQKYTGMTALGGVLGYCAGIATKKIGTFVLFVIGSIFIAIQYLSFKGYLNVNWDRVGSKHAPKFTKEKRQKYYKFFYKLITHDLPFKAGFSGGFYLGFKNS